MNNMYQPLKSFSWQTYPQTPHNPCSRGGLLACKIKVTPLGRLSSFLFFEWVARHIFTASSRGVAGIKRVAGNEHPLPPL